MNNHQNELFDVMTKEKYIFGLNSPKDLASKVRFRSLIYLSAFKFSGILEQSEKGFLIEYSLPEKNIISKIVKELYE